MRCLFFRLYTMKLLTAINGILPVLGEHTVTSVQAKNPALAIILPNIDLEISNISRPGLWFNTFETTYYPDSELGISVGTDVLSIVPVYANVNCIQRGTRLMNADTQSYEWTTPVKVHITTLVPFEELPESVAVYVLYAALVTSYATDIGLEGSIQLWQQKAKGAMVDVTREHLRNRRYSISKSPRFGKLLSSMVA
jgi:hypothetical protein